jgi:colanic acid biosynthesis glycosyl transferase WcaI
VVLDAAALARDDASMTFLLVGDGADCERIQRRADELRLENVRFLPLLDEADFRGLLAASGFCLVTQQRGVSEIAFPSKIVTYLAAGRPIIASVNPDSEVGAIARESGAGRVAGPENPEALVAAIRAMRAEDLGKASENARAYAIQMWSSARVLGHLEETLMAVVGSARGPIMKEGASQ